MRDSKRPVALVTGANTGIGRSTAEALAAKGYHVVLACRTESKAAPVIAGLTAAHGEDAASFLALDLADLAKVKVAAEQWLARGQSLELLVNNAGLAGQRGETAQGFELTFGVNHLGHFLFTLLLLERSKQSAPARIVNVASKAHYLPKAWDWEPLRGHTTTKTGYPEYGVSKLANVLFTAALARRLEGTGVTSYSLHPGVVASDIWRKVPFPFRGLIKLFMISEDEGARTTLYCATDPELASVSGRYYSDQRETKPSRLARDEELQEELWSRSEAWVAEFRT